MPNHIPKMYISGERLIALKARAIAMNVFLAKARNTYSPRGVGDELANKNDLELLGHLVARHSTVFVLYVYSALR